MKYSILLLILTSLSLHAQDWELVEDLAPEASAESDFGQNMVLADGKLIVSWPRVFTKGNDADSCGEVITYEKVNGQWQDIVRLTAENLTGSCTQGDGFGFGLAFDEGRLAIGMPAGARAGLGESGGMTDADSRVFMTHWDENQGNWVLDETLAGSDIGSGRGMGGQLVLEDNMLLVHAHEYDSIFGVKFVVSTGVYVFEDNGSGFTETQKLEENFHLFGQDFDYENGQIIVGAWGEQALTQPGRIYVYEKSGDQWQAVQTINDTRNSNLGNQIEILGDSMVAGNVQAGGIGGVSVYNKDAEGQWTEVQFIQADDSAVNDQFGIALKMDEDEIVIGATAGENQVQTLGAVYIFSKGDNGQYSQQQKLVASNPGTLYDRYGGNVVFNDTDLLVNSNSGGFANGDVTSFHHYSRDAGDDNGSTYDIDAKVSGVWKSEYSDTQTISIEILSDGRAVLYAGLNRNEESFWIVGVGSISDHIMDFSTVYSTTGARFGTNFNPADVQIIDEGEIQIAFNACNNALLSYDINDVGAGEVHIHKDLEIPGLECGSTNKNIPTGVSGSWLDREQPGQGFTVYVGDNDGVQTAAVSWFTYDDSGKQIVYIGHGEVIDNVLTLDKLISIGGGYIFSGGESSTVNGNLTLTFGTCNNAHLEYDFGDDGSGSHNLSQLTQVDGTTCDLPIN